MEFLPAAGAAGIFSMLVALFTLSMRAILQTGERADSRADKEIERLHRERQLDEVKHQAMIEAKNEEIAYWRDRYLELVRTEDRSGRRPDETS